IREIADCRLQIRLQIRLQSQTPICNLQSAIYNLQSAIQDLCDSFLMHRFFAPALDPGDETVLLPRDEAEHLTRVLRLGVGDTVSVFDGRGREFLARVASAVRRNVTVQLVSRLDPAIEPAVHLTLVQAIIK